MGKEELRALVRGLVEADLRTLRSIINGMLGKRTITTAQQAAMQEARRAKKQTGEAVYEEANG